MSPRLPMNSQPGLPTSNSHERRDEVSTRSGSDGVERSEFQAALAGDRAATPSASDSFTRSIRAYRFAPPRLPASMPSVSWGLVFFLLPTADWLGAASRESPGDHHIRPSRLRLIQPLYLSLHGPHPAARGIRPSLVVH